MFNAGVVRPGSTVYIPVNTFDSNDPSASVTATTWANTDCHIHKDGGTTQRASSAGETLTIDFDSIAGGHMLAIDTADNTTANFYEAGSTYHVRIEGVTVDAGNINAWIGCFTIGYPDAILNTTIATLASQTGFTLEEGPADNDALNGCRVVIHDLASAVQLAIGVISDYVGSTKTVTLKADPGIFTMAAGDSISAFMPALTATAPGATLDVTVNGAAGIDWSNVENPTTALDLSGTDIQLVDTTTTNTDMVGTDSAALASVCTEARLAELSSTNLPQDIDAILVDTGTTLQAELDGIQADTEDIQTQIGTAGAGLTDLGGMSTGMKAEVESEANDALVAQKLDHLVAVAESDDPVDDSIIAKLANSAATADWSAYVNTTDSLMAIRDRGDAEWVTGGGGSDRLLMADTTIATLASQTSFTLTAGSADDDAYNNCTIVIEDASTATQKAVGLILDYTGSSKTVTLKYDPTIFTMATTDKVYILAENALKSTDQNRQLDVTATGGAGIDWANVENPTTALDLSGTDTQLCDTVTTNTDMVGTDSAALASVATEARLAELDAANIPADVDAVLVDTSTTLDAALAVVDANVDQIETAVITNAAGADVSADIAAVKAETVLIVADTNELQTDDVPTLIAALNDIATSDVLTQVNAALDTAIAELGVAAPTATPTLRTGLMLMYMLTRNKLVVQTSGTDAIEVYNDAGTKIAAKAIVDDGSDYTESEMA